MYDIHCHVLPNLDDGARDKAEALSLLHLAVQQGITHIVVTPHIQPGHYNNCINTIRTAFNSFTELAKGINVKLAFAAEARLDAELIPLILAEKIPFIGEFQGQHVLLLELPHSHVPAGTEKFIKWLANQNVRPLIAHPERNREIQQNPSLAAWLFELGCLMQGTASSLTGDFGEKAFETLSVLLSNKQVFAIASDAHSTKRRPPKMQDAFTIVANTCGQDVAHSLFVANPQLLTQRLFT